jgi:hypothetical protein
MRKIHELLYQATGCLSWLPGLWINYVELCSAIIHLHEVTTALQQNCSRTAVELCGCYTEDKHVYDIYGCYGSLQYLWSTAVEPCRWPRVCWCLSLSILWRGLCVRLNPCSCVLCVQQRLPASVAEDSHIWQKRHMVYLSGLHAVAYSLNDQEEPTGCI